MEVVLEGGIEVDYIKKRDLYRRTGTQEYWIIDWQRQLIEVWSFSESSARAVSYTRGGSIETSLIPGLVVSVNELLS
jgi:Uma2 family endonuclease